MEYVCLVDLTYISFYKSLCILPIVVVLRFTKVVCKHFLNNLVYKHLLILCNVPNSSPPPPRTRTTGPPKVGTATGPPRVGTATGPPKVAAVPPRLAECEYFRKTLSVLKNWEGDVVYAGKDVPFFIIKCAATISQFLEQSFRPLDFNHFNSDVSYNPLISSIITNTFQLTKAKPDEPAYVIKTFLLQLPESLLSAYIYREV